MRTFQEAPWGTDVTRIPVLLGHVKDPRNRDSTVSSSSLAWLCRLGQILLLNGLSLPTCERGIVIPTLDSYCVGQNGVSPSMDSYHHG